MKKYVYSFGNGTADGDGKMKDTLGGKGAGLAEMCRAKLPVPPGFTISTEVCNIYFQNNNKVPQEVQEQMLECLRILEERMGQKLGDADNPLLVSVRSGAKFSMPGMMDTILNLGPERQDREGARGQGGRRALRLRLLPPLHPDVRQRRAGHPEGRVRARLRRPEEEGRREAGYRPERRRTCRPSSPATRSWCRRRPASRSRRMPCSSWRAPATPCSAPGSTTAPSTTAG